MESCNDDELPHIEWGELLAAKQPDASSGLCRRHSLNGFQQSNLGKKGSIGSHENHANIIGYGLEGILTVRKSVHYIEQTCWRFCRWQSGGFSVRRDLKKSMRLSTRGFCIPTACVIEPNSSRFLTWSIYSKILLFLCFLLLLRSKTRCRICRSGSPWRW